MFTGSLVLDVLLGDVRSLKDKRAVVRPLVAELRRRYAVSAAEVGDADLHRRAEIGVAVVAGEPGHVLLSREVRPVADSAAVLLDELPRLVEARRIARIGGWLRCLQGGYKVGGRA